MLSGQSDEATFEMEGLKKLSVRRSRLLLLYLPDLPRTKVQWADQGNVRRTRKEEGCFRGRSTRGDRKYVVHQRVPEAAPERPFQSIRHLYVKEKSRNDNGMQIVRGVEKSATDTLGG
jgi:hypothetical protein